MNSRWLFGIVLAFVLVAAILGAGALGFNVGLTQGMAGGQVVAPATGAAPYVFGAPWLLYRPWGFGFGILNCLFPFLVFLLIFGVLRGVFWRGHWGGGMHRRDWYRGVPPAFDEWHRQAHASASGEPAKPAPEE